MKQHQIDSLKARPDYHLMVAVLGEYDDSKDYMGPGSNWKTKLVPRTLWGIDCNIASYIHDYKYFKGGSERDRLKADREFLYDLIGFIEDHKCNWLWGTRWIHMKLARSRADKYYLAVKTFGGLGSFNYHV